MTTRDDVGGLLFTLSVLVGFTALLGALALFAGGEPSAGARKARVLLLAIGAVLFLGGVWGMLS
jgi:hypothetical protein